jgi:iron-sulfur cluster assembly accessory protein
MNLMNLNRFRSQSGVWLLALLLVMLGEFGCSEPPPMSDPAVSAPATATNKANADTTPAATASPPPASTPSAAIQLTDVAAARIRDIMQEQGEEYLLVSVNVAENCKGFRYNMKLGQPEPEERYELGVVKNLKVAVEKDDAKFLQGTVLDYLQEDEPGQTGFKFNNPHEDVMLLPEYQQMAEQMKQKWETDKEKSKTIDPQKAWAELMTPNRQLAYESLQIYNRYFGPHPETSPPANGKSGLYDYDREVTHVMQIPDATGEMLIAVFTNGRAGFYLGNCSLFDQKGLEVATCYLNDGDFFADMNGDGVWELTKTITAGIQPRAGGQRAVGCCRKFSITTIGRNSRCLLTIAFDAQKQPTDSKWKCMTVPSISAQTDRISDVVLFTPSPQGLLTAAQYIWLADKKQFEGPLSGSGFIARMGEMSAEEGSIFWHAEMGE